MRSPMAKVGAEALSWGCARPRRWRRGESLHHAVHITKAWPPNLELRLFNEGYGFGSRGTPGDCASWKRLLSCQLSYFNFGLTIIIRVPLSSIFYLL
ncbi:hypothetical protein ZEAMMB73_Zm00001d007805 [Zea mays]|uniref:Uncharacterized protein n=1 Tax=Zea mays TaxID=4577 RepID=A0A1D6F8X5_MAIZE|nr:hypothetical protein ZEAMMB73_Zm00001d007805 [Zea mays]ONM27607.1 hypothetical protein ZEAMMB73_Zm00001d007805 [Zea mays]ONM27608.1 hypothetical protein ZEAMMB73_Zm00001d007805 [Zea mays]